MVGVEGEPTVVASTCADGVGVDNEYACARVEARLQAMGVAEQEVGVGACGGGIYIDDRAYAAGALPLALEGGDDACVALGGHAELVVICKCRCDARGCVRVLRLVWWKCGVLMRCLV